MLVNGESQQICDLLLVDMSVSSIIMTSYIFLTNVVQGLSCFHKQWWPNHHDALWDSAYHSFGLDSSETTLSQASDSSRASVCQEQSSSEEPVVFHLLLTCRKLREYLVQRQTKDGQDSFGFNPC